MPRLVDYSARFHCIREAVFSLTLREGPTAISGPAVAAELGMSVSSVRRLVPAAEHLPRLGLEWVEYRQRGRLWHHLPELIDETEGWHRAANALLKELPFNDDRADDERVWWRLVTAFGSEPWAHQADGAQRSHLEGLVGSFVRELPGLVDPEFERQRLHALMSGATADVRAGGIDPQGCLTLVRRHLAEVAAARRGQARHGAA